MSRTALSSHHSRQTLFTESLAFDDDYELTSHSHAHRTHKRVSFFSLSLCLQPTCTERALAPASPSGAESFYDITSHTLLALSRRLGSSTSPPCSFCCISLGAQGTSVCLRFYSFCCCKTMIPPLSSARSHLLSLSLSLPLGRSRRSRSFAVGFKWQCKIN